MNWDLLKGALQGMNPAGQAGFEGIVATLLSELTGEPFVVARTGDQHGDARNRPGVTQVKRYRRARLTEAQAEKDFHSSRRELPHMEVYVLAITKSNAQIQSRFELQADTAIDCIILDWDGASPSIGSTASKPAGSPYSGRATPAGAFATISEFRDSAQKCEEFFRAAVWISRAATPTVSNRSWLCCSPGCCRFPLAVVAQTCQFNGKAPRRGRRR